MYDHEIYGRHQWCFFLGYPLNARSDFVVITLRCLAATRRSPAVFARSVAAVKR